MNDKLLIAGVIGAFSTIPAEIVTQGLVFFGIGTHSIYNISSLLITIDRPSTIMGLFVSPVFGCFIGMLVYSAFNKRDSNHLIIANVLIAILMWIGLETIFTLYIEGIHIPTRPVSDYYVHLVGAVIFGITEGLLLRRFLFDKCTV